MQLPWWLPFVVSFALAFVRYRFPALHPRAASAGIGACVVGAVAGLLDFDAPLLISMTLNGALAGALIDQSLSKVGRGAEVPADPNAPARIAHRQQIIADGRKLVADFNLQARARTLFDFLKYRPEYPALRGHLSPEFRRDLENGIMVGVAIGVKDPNVFRFMAELDRLEREWGLA